MARFNQRDWPGSGAWREFLLALDELHLQSGCPSLRAIGAQMHLDHSRVSDLVRGVSLPAGPEQARALVLAIAGRSDPPPSADAVAEILGLYGRARRERDERSARPVAPVVASAAAPAAAPAVTEPAASRSGFRRRGAWVLVAVLLAGSVVLGLALFGGRASTDQAAAEPAGCAFTADGAATVRPRVRSAPADLVFCPVRINDGRLPIVGPFRLEGQVLGPVGERGHILLWNTDAPGTCDADGNAALSGRFVIHEAVVDSADGSWSYVDPLGYPEAVTYGRHFEYVMGSADVLGKLRDDPELWLAQNPGAKIDDYPGVEPSRMPQGISVLAEFDVPAGLYRGRAGSCTPALPGSAGATPESPAR